MIGKTELYNNPLIDLSKNGILVILAALVKHKKRSCRAFDKAMTDKGKRAKTAE